MLAFAIMTDAADLSAWLGAGLAALGLGLDDRVGLRSAEAFAARPWHAVTSPCPFVGPLAGYAVVDEVAVGRDLLRSLARLGRGVVAALEDDRAAMAVALRRFALEEVVAPGGLDQGRALLDRDPASVYAAEVRARVTAAAAAAGLRIRLDWHAHAGNPLRLYRVQPIGSDQAYPPIWTAGGAVHDPLRPLHGLTVDLWSYDLALFAADAPGRPGWP